jgi:hypothetical protein
VGDPTRQRHDFEPGIARSGLAWTIPISTSAISYDVKTGQARFHARNMRVKDFHDFLSAVNGGGPKPVVSHVSFDVRWHGGGQHRKLHDKKFGFEGEYVSGPATVTFTAGQDGSNVVYRSDPSGQYNPTVKQMGAGSPAFGRERNGTFFH